MKDEMNKMIFENTPNQVRANELIGKLFEVANGTAVFSEPVKEGEYTVITASEVTAAMGAGYGGGGGFDSKDEGGDGGYGGGGGGGGTAVGRPVAAIVIGPDGVQVKEIVDPTKIAVAFFTTIFGIFMALGKMRRGK